MNRKAVALLSGGLDSMLSVRLILDQGIPVTGLRFVTPFGCETGSGGSCGRDVESLARVWAPLGLDVRIIPLGQEYVERVRNPLFGRGRNMNPCVDCRVLMLQWARLAMEREGAGFLVTGEVLNQRAMSQTRDRLRQIDRAAGVEGLVLRPLSARRLDPTLPERMGVVDRERLLDLSGRGRTRQYELAARYGIAEIPQPGGGCLLTDPEYSERLRDLWEHDPGAGLRDLELLKVGRHFRPGPHCKIVVGRDEEENRVIEALETSGDALLFLRDYEGPTVLVRGAYGPEDLRLAASLAVRYGDVPGKAASQVVVRRQGEYAKIVAEGAREEVYAPLRVGVKAQATRGKRGMPQPGGWRRP